MSEEEQGEKTQGEEQLISLQDCHVISPRLVTIDQASADMNDSPRISEQEYAESLQDENVSLRRRLAETEYGFQRRLDRQTELISKLQEKLKDSQRRMAELEASERNISFSTAAVSPLSPASAGTMRRSETSVTEENLLGRLLDEQEKTSTLQDVNMTLRQELEEMRSANFHLTSDLLRVTQLYDRVRSEANRQNEEYKKTETSYVSHFATEHRQMLNLWRSMQQLRREFMDIRSMAARGLSSMESEFQRAVNTVSTACRHLSLRSAYAVTSREMEKAGVSQESQSPNANSIEQLVWANIRRLAECQDRKEEEIKNLQIRFDELLDEKRSFESYVMERDRQIEVLKKTLIESKEEKEDIFYEYLYNSLRDMVESSFRDTHDGGGVVGTTVMSPRRRARSHSPRDLRSRAAAETIVRMVREAFARRQNEIKDLSSRLKLVQQRLAEADKTTGILPTDRDRLEKEFNELSSRLSVLQRERDEAIHQKEKFRSQLTTFQNERMASEKKLRDTLDDQLSSISSRLDASHKKILELENKESRLEDEKDRLLQELDRAKSETARLRNQLESSQTTLTDIRGEISKLKSTVMRLENENRDLSSENGLLNDRLVKENAKTEELTTEIDRLSSIEKSFIGQLSTLQAMIKALNQDKQVALRDRQTLKVRLDQCERDRENLKISKESMENDVRRLNEQLNGLQHEKANWIQEKSALTSQLERRNLDLREFESQLSNLSKEYTEMEAQLKTAIQKQNDLENQLESARRELNSEQHFRSETQNERRQLVAERTEMEQRVTSLIEQIRRMEASSHQLEEKTQSEILSYETKLCDSLTKQRESEAYIADMSKKMEDALEKNRTLESRLNSLQSILVSQEELLRTKENERRLISGRIGQLEVELRRKETQLKLTSEKHETLNSDWQKTQMESQRFVEERESMVEERRLKELKISELLSDIHRLRVQFNEAATDKEALENRFKVTLDQLQKEEQRNSLHQSELERCKAMLTQASENENDLRAQLESVRASLSEYTFNGQTLHDQVIHLQHNVRTLEQEKRMLDDRLRDAKEQLVKCKKELKERADALGDNESRMADLESKFAANESQLKTLQKMLDISQETEADLKRQLEQLVNQKQSSQNRLSDLQRKCQQLEVEKREWASLKLKLESERNNFKNELANLQKERRKNENMVRNSELERAALDKAVSAIEKENVELHHAMIQLQNQLSKMEQTHAQKLAELSQRHCIDADAQINRLRTEKHEALRQLEMLEKIYKQKLKTLEDQIVRLKDQLKQEARRRQDYFTKAMRQSQDVAKIRAGLDQSFASLRNDPLLDSLLLHSTEPPRRRHGFYPDLGGRIRPSTSAGETNITIR